MAFILPIEEPWTSQPQGVVEIDRGNPITRGLTCAWTGNGLWFGPSGFSQILTQNATSKSGIGRSTFGTGSNAERGFLPDGSFGGGASGTRLVLATHGSSTSQQNLTSTSVAGNMQLRTSLGQISFVKKSVAVSITAGSVAAGELFSVIGSYGAENRLYKNGVLVGTDAANKVVITTGTPCLAQDGSSGSPWVGGALFFAAAWDRQLSDAEAATVGDNPWQIFAP